MSRTIVSSLYGCLFDTGSVTSSSIKKMFRKINALDFREKD